MFPIGIGAVFIHLPSFHQSDLNSANSLEKLMGFSQYCVILWVSCCLLEFQRAGGRMVSWGCSWFGYGFPLLLAAHGSALGWPDDSIRLVWLVLGTGESSSPPPPPPGARQCSTPIDYIRLHSAKPECLLLPLLLSLPLLLLLLLPLSLLLPFVCTCVVVVRVCRQFEERAFLVFLLVQLIPMEF
jgi:hypothetical protein